MALDRSLFEFFDNRGAPLRVDRPRAVLRGVKVLGTVSKNGREYSAAALAGAVPLYEGAKVNVNHAPGDPNAPRDYRDRIGCLRGARAANDGLYADLHFNPKHALAEQLLWDAEHAPENVGLSHHVRAKTALVDGRTVVEQIVKVHSVDLVADPATTHGLFERISWEDSHVELQTIAWNDLKKLRPDLVEAARAEFASPTGDVAAATAAGEITRLREELDSLQARERLRERRDEIDRQIAAARLPAELATAALVEQLMSADPETARRVLEERRQLAAAFARTAPRSVEQYAFDRSAAGAPHDARSFAELLK